MEAIGWLVLQSFFWPPPLLVLSFLFIPGMVVVVEPWQELACDSKLARWEKLTPHKGHGPPTSSVSSPAAALVILPHHQLATARCPVKAVTSVNLL